MPPLKSEIVTPCPCCGARLTFDLNLRRIVGHEQPERGDKPELADAERIVKAQADKREALFRESFEAEKTRDDDLSKRFEEALKQAKVEPITKPIRDWELD